MKSGITEKRLADQRFKKTEEAMLRVFFDAKDYISVKSLAAKIGVARSTIYCHHGALRKILPDYEEYILKKYSRMIHKIAQKGEINIKILYINILLFILRDKKIFEVLSKNGDKTVFEAMILKIRSEIEEKMGLPKNSEKLYAVFASEMATLMKRWGKRNFVEKDMNMILSDMLFLTKTARTRLAKLLD